MNDMVSTIKTNGFYVQKIRTEFSCTFEIIDSSIIGAASPYGTTPRDALDSVTLDFDLKVLTMETL